MSALLACGSDGKSLGPQDALAETLEGDGLLDLQGPADTLVDLAPDLACPDSPSVDLVLTDSPEDSAAALDLEAGELAVDLLDVEVPCVPVCENADQSPRVCGPDGCGGICGSCDLEHSCVDGACLPFCEPKCEGRECGGDGCYGQCPPGCPENYLCGEDGHCYPACDPFEVCKDRDCGPDGCGGSCGDCPQGYQCEASQGKCLAVPCTGIPAKGLCVDDRYLVQCVDMQRQETDCGAMEGGGYCHYNALSGKNECKAGCLPSCQGRQCGDNGCGGVCGSCPGGWDCLEGQCSPVQGAECGWFTDGNCEGQILWACVEGKLAATDCQTLEPPRHCGWTMPSGPFACLP
jgi:hypothetical protein